jgi:hypothetical protein
VGCKRRFDIEKVTPMAFTLQEIEQVLSVPYHEGYQPNGSLKNSGNYPIIVDYLSGQSKSLQGLQYDNNIYHWGSVVRLLRNVEKPSANDQLVLDLVLDPFLGNYLQGYFTHWLVSYVKSNPSDSAFNTVLNYFYKFNYTDDQVFNYLLNMLQDPRTNERFSLDGHKALKKFLTDHIKNARQLIHPHFGTLGWNIVYFTLLEEVRPQWAVDYAFHGAVLHNPHALGQLASYNKGRYLPLIIEFLRNQQNPNLNTLQAKFYAALFFYDSDPGKYKELAVEMSQQYLDYTRIHGNEYIRWEGGYSLKELAKEEWRHLGFTSCAFYLLLKYERASGMQALEALLEKKSFVPIQTLQVLSYHLGTDAFPYVLRALESDNSSGGVEYYKSLFGLLKERYEPHAYLPSLWKFTSTKSKPLKELVASTLAEIDTEAEAKAIALLENKNAETRQTAALILSRFSTATAKEAINKVLDKETNDNARDILLQTIADSLPQDASREFIDSMIAAAKERGKLNKPVEAWLHENELPALYYTDGTEVGPDATRFLLYRMSRVKGMRSDPEAKLLIKHLDKKRSSPFALHLMKLYLDKQATPEHKYLVAVAALLGDDTVVDKIRTTINNWIDNNRAKMAEHGVGALALQGSDKALRWVEWYSRKYKNKKANVGQAATQALEDAAEELQITTHELGDRIVPDFGFEGLFRHFTIGTDEYRAFIDSNFKLAFFNEDNKKLKSLPAAASAELKDEFKSLAKEVRDVVRSQSSRLEHYLVVQRRWTVAQWQQVFLNNPIMFIYATKLLWGIYENRNLTQCFVCQEDTTLIDKDDNEVSLPDEAMIGIAHPMQLSTQDLQIWRRKFFDLSIEPIFPQLERPFSKLNDDEKDTTIVKKFTGLKTDAASIRSTLERYGWAKAAGDGGHIDFFTYNHHEEHIRVYLEVEGVYVYFTQDSEAKLGKLYFLNMAKEKNRWFSLPQNEKDERLIPIGELPPVFYSEVMASIGSIKLKE